MSAKIKPEASDALLHDLWLAGKLSTRAHYCILNGIGFRDRTVLAKTTGDIAAMSDQEILLTPNLGTTTLLELRLLCGPIPKSRAGSKETRRKRAAWVRAVQMHQTDVGFDEWVETAQ